MPLEKSKNENLSRFAKVLRYFGNAKTVLGLILVIFYLFAVANCSHTKPYYRSHSQPSGNVSINSGQVSQRILLIGDAGAPAEAEPTLTLLRRWAEEMPAKTAVLFLGDNIYPYGLPPETDPGRAEAERRLTVQIESIRNSGAQGIFVPGNHDWAHGRAIGLENLTRQAAFVDSLLPGEDNFLPRNGCPGPVKLDLKEVRLIVLDSHWWLHKHRKGAPCSPADKEGVVRELREMAASAGEREVIIAAHHALDSHGPHGGFFSWKDHIFPLTNLKSWLWVPLPIIGSLYPLGRWHIVKSDQDMASPNYREMIARITEAVSESRPLIYAAGHDHNLQVLQMDKGVEYILVSGAGIKSKINEVGHGDNTLFAHAHSGFMALDFMEDDRVLLRVVEPGEREVVFQKWIK